MTWLEFRQAVEKAGVQDEDEIHFIDTEGFKWQVDALLNTGVITTKDLETLHPDLEYGWAHEKLLVEKSWQGVTIVAPVPE